MRKRIKSFETHPQGSAHLQHRGPAAVFDFGASNGFWQKSPDLRRPGRPRKPPEACRWRAPQSSSLPCVSKPRGAPVTRQPGSRAISRAEQPPSQLRQPQQLARGASLEKSLSSLLAEEAFSRTSSRTSKAKPLLTTGGSAAAHAEKKTVRLLLSAVSNPARLPTTGVDSPSGATGPTFLWSTWGTLQKPKSDEPPSHEQPEELKEELSVGEDSGASFSSWGQKKSLISRGGAPPESGPPRGGIRGDSAEEDLRASTRAPPNLLPCRVPAWQRPLIGCGKQRPAAASCLQTEPPWGLPQNIAIVATGTGMLSRCCSAGDLQGLRNGGLQAKAGGIRRDASWPHPLPQQQRLLPPPAAAAAAEAEARQPCGALRSFSQSGQAQPWWNLVTTQSISSAAARAAREAAAAAAAAAADAAAAVASRTHSPGAKAIAAGAAAAAARGLAPPAAAAAECSPISKQRGDPQPAILIKQLVAAPAAAAKRPATSSSSANPSSSPDGKALLAPDFQTEAAAGAAAANAEEFVSAVKTVRGPEDPEPGVGSEPAGEAVDKEDSEAAPAAAATVAGAAREDWPKAATAPAKAAPRETAKRASTAKAATREAANGAASAKAAGAAEAAAPEGSAPGQATRTSGSSPAPCSCNQSSCSEWTPPLSPRRDGSSSARRKIEEVLKQPLFRPRWKPWKLFEVQRPLRLKVVTLGPSGSGKSCLVRRFCERRFVGVLSPAGAGEGPPVGGERRPSHAQGGQTPGSACTIALDFGVRDVMLETGEKVRLHFIDLSGAPEFSDVGVGGPLKGADVVLGVFDAAQPEALQPTLSSLLGARQQTGGALSDLLLATHRRQTSESLKRLKATQEQQ
ncbi:hypothetical protein Esti_002728 [Eimeria stiedai]